MSAPILTSGVRMGNKSNDGVTYLCHLIQFLQFQSVPALRLFDFQIRKYTLASGLVYDNLEYRQREIRKLGSLRRAERDPNGNGIPSLGNND
jgi:hypothetical protein